MVILIRPVVLRVHAGSAHRTTVSTDQAPSPRYDMNRAAEMGVTRYCYMVAGLLYFTGLLSKRYLRVLVAVPVIRLRWCWRSLGTGWRQSDDGVMVPSPYGLHRVAPATEPARQISPYAPWAQSLPRTAEVPAAPRLSQQRMDSYRPIGALLCQHWRLVQSSSTARLSTKGRYTGCFFCWRPRHRVLAFLCRGDVMPYQRSRSTPPVSPCRGCPCCLGERCRLPPPAPPTQRLFLPTCIFQRAFFSR